MLAADQFFKKLNPHARAAARALSLPEPNFVPVALAQWAHESGFESPNWVGGLNYAGITDGGPPNFLQFATMEEFVACYIRTLQNGYYDRILEAARAGRPAREVARILGESPWDAGHYTDDQADPGRYLIRMIDAYKLDQLSGDPSPWAAAAWAWALERGITDGTRPRDPATREELVTMLHRLNHSG